MHALGGGRIQYRRGERMHCYSFGSGSPIVYLHGWGCDGTIFMPVAKKMPCFNNVMVDFNGFGKSQPPPESGWTVERYASELYLFFLQYNLQNAVIVAHSFGCRVALVFAAKYPQLVKKMLLFAPAGMRRFSVKRTARVLCFKLGRFLGLSGTKELGSDDYKACNAAMKNTFVKVINDDLSRFAKRVVCPTLIVCGDGDKQVPLWQAKKLHRLIKGAQLTVIGGDHFSLFSTPARFAEIIEIFAEDSV